MLHLLSCVYHPWVWQNYQANVCLCRNKRRAHHKIWASLSSSSNALCNAKLGLVRWGHHAWLSRECSSVWYSHSLHWNHPNHIPRFRQGESPWECRRRHSASLRWVWGYPRWLLHRSHAANWHGLLYALQVQHEKEYRLADELGCRRSLRQFKLSGGGNGYSVLLAVCSAICPASFGRVLPICMGQNMLTNEWIIFMPFICKWMG